MIAEGIAEVRAPACTRWSRTPPLPGMTVARHRHVERLMAACRGLPPMRTAVVAPEEENALLGALAGARAGLIVPILIGDAAKIRATAAACGADLAGFEIEDVPSDDAAAARAVEMVHQGSAAAMMKGHLHTDDAAAPRGEIRRRAAHRPAHQPCLRHGRAVAAGTAAGDRRRDQHRARRSRTRSTSCRTPSTWRWRWASCVPKVGILSAVETVNPKMQSTLDAAALSKMAERGQIRGGIVDGPLAMDNAISLTAARTKGLTSLVAGPGRHPGGAEPGGRQHPGQGADLRRPGRGRRAGAGREGADHADQPRRRRGVAAVFLRRRASARSGHWKSITKPTGRWHSGRSMTSCWREHQHSRRPSLTSSGRTTGSDRGAGRCAFTGPKVKNGKVTPFPWTQDGH